MNFDNFNLDGLKKEDTDQMIADKAIGDNLMKTMDTILDNQIKAKTKVVPIKNGVEIKEKSEAEKVTKKAQTQDIQPAVPSTSQGGQDVPETPRQANSDEIQGYIKTLKDVVSEIQKMAIAKKEPAPEIIEKEKEPSEEEPVSSSMDTVAKALLSFINNQESTGERVVRAPKGDDNFKAFMDSLKSGSHLKTFKHITGEPEKTKKKELKEHHQPDDLEAQGSQVEEKIVTEDPIKIDEPVIRLKLESIQLPYFSGDLTEWVAFKDLFVYLVHRNTTFSDTLKFHQLRTHVRGPPFEMIKGYQITGTNYRAAWEDLKRRYDKKDELMAEYIRKFLEVPPIIGKATFNKIRTIVDATNQMLRALPSLEISVENWDPFLVLILNMKMDEETRNDWKTKRGRTPDTNVADLLEFLETRAGELYPTQGDKLSQLLKGDTNRRNPRKVFQITEKKEKKPENLRTCPICKGNHPVWRCERLKRECAKVRTEMIKSLKLCFKCLLKHEVGLCDITDCPYCGGPHNSLLCYKRENDEKARKAEPNPNWKPKAEKPKQTWKDDSDWEGTPPKNVK